MVAGPLYIQIRKNGNELIPGNNRKGARLWCKKPKDESGQDAGPPALTAVLFIAAIWTVLKPVTPEAADDAVDAAGTWEEGRATFRLSLGCRRTNKINKRDVRRISFLSTAYPSR